MSFLGIPNLEVGRYIRSLVKSGQWLAQKTPNNHVRLEHVSGAIYFTGSTPSDPRALKNLKASIRRIERANSRPLGHNPANRRDGCR